MPPERRVDRTNIVAAFLFIRSLHFSLCFSI
jgi:hypothetical protein